MWIKAREGSAAAGETRLDVRGSSLGAEEDNGPDEVKETPLDVQRPSLGTKEDAEPEIEQGLWMEAARA